MNSVEGLIKTSFDSSVIHVYQVNVEKNYFSFYSLLSLLLTTMRLWLNKIYLCIAISPCR